MMKMFVAANTMLVLLTVAWPNIKESLFIIRDYFMGDYWKIVTKSKQENKVKE